MAKLLKLRRGTTSQHSSFTGAEGEVTVDTTKDTLVVHDGSTAGGTPLAKESALSAINTDLSNDTTPQLGGDLDVNTKNIVLGDSSDGATDDTIKFGAGTDLSIYSDGSNGTFLIPNAGNLFIKQGSSTLATFSGASNQIDFNEDVVFVGAASNGLWDKSASKFVANVQGDLTGTADAATAVSVTASNSTAATTYPLFAGSGATATGDLTPHTDTGLTYNSSTGLLTAVGLTLSGDLTVNGSTTTINTTNTKVTDNLLELNSGATSNANDSGIIIERGSTGDNAIIAWDESADKFIVGTTTATNDATGDLTIATGTLVANVEGTVSTATTATNVTVADESSDTTCFPTFVTAATGDLPPKTGSNLTFNSSTGVLAATKVSDALGDLRIIPGSSVGSANAPYNIATTDSGKVLLAAGNVSVGQFMTTNMAVSVINTTSGDITISMNLGNLYWTADASSASRTLASRGMCTIWFADWNTAYISGSGLS